MAKIKSSKTPQSMEIFLIITVRRSYRDLAHKLTPQEKIELEVIRISIETDVSR